MAASPAAEDTARPAPSSVCLRESGVAVPRPAFLVLHYKVKPKKLQRSSKFKKPPTQETVRPSTQEM